MAFRADTKFKWAFKLMVSNEELISKVGSSKARTPLIIQSEVSECGLACLAMISGYYGYDTDMTTLRRQFSISSHGTTLKQLIDIASSMKLTTRALQLDIESIGELQLPCVLHWEMNHFVVLTSVDKKTIKVNDPAQGERVISFEDFSKSFTGIALEVLPAEDFKAEKNKSKLKLGHFWSKITGLKRSLISIFVLSLLLQFFALAMPFYLQTVIDDVIQRSDSNLLLVLAIGFGLLMVINTATSLLRDLVLLNFSSLMNVQMAANVFRHLIRLPMDYFSKRHMGDVVSRFGSLETVRELFTTKLIAAVIDGLLAVLTLVAMFVYNVKLAIVVVFISAIYLFIRLALYRPIRNLTEESIVASAKENTHFMESVRAIQTIKLFQKESDRQSQWQNRLVNSVNKKIQISKWEIGFDVANKLLFGIENILIVYLAATAVLGNLMSVGMLYAFISYKGRFIDSMSELINTWIEFKMLEVHLNRLGDVLFTKKEVLSFNGLETKSLIEKNKGIKGSIEVKGLGFAYASNDPLIFEDLNLEIAPSEVVAIVGSSGAGKTTLLKCLMGFLNPSHGLILIDGLDITQTVEYRSQIAGVMQDDQLLTGSILENIACFDESADIDKVIDSSKAASIHDDILVMPMQYNTLVGDMGDTLSGGQKQRIILARALYRKPRILFLDEATSSLDSRNESLINENISKLGITCIIVAHRKETINSADRVIDISSI